MESTTHLDTESHISQHPDPNEIKKMFAAIADNYDKANNVLSAGVHHLWRKKLVELSGARFGDSVLDCATGTGDLAIEFKKIVGETGHVIGSDFCKEMLERAPAKAKAHGLNITFELADVTALPYADESFDIATISFGIRNVADPKKALAELFRVIKPGGKVLVLEFGQPKLPVFSNFYRLYSAKLLTFFGGLLTGRKDAYQYLEKSSAAFPCREAFIELMKESAHYTGLKYTSLTGGIAYIYVGSKAFAV